MMSPEAPDVPAGEILVVEDTPNSRALLADLLKRAGYDVRQAPDGELALWTVRSRVPDLILLDIRMPGIDGFEICRRLKSSPATASIPVIFLSALDDVEDKVRGFTVGAVDYIAKPYQAEEVLARVRTHLTLVRLTKTLSAERTLFEDRVRERTAELHQRESEMARVLAALDLAGDGIMIINAEGKIIYSNRVIPKLLGSPAMEEIFSLEDRIPALFEPLADHDHGGWRGEVAVRREGHAKPDTLLVHVRELPGGNRVMVVSDITERKRQEMELLEAKNRAEAGDQAKAIFLAIMGHEFHTPLNAIIGFAEIMTNADCGSPSGANFPAYSQQIIESGKTLLTLLDDILKLSKMSSGDPGMLFELFHLQQFIEDAISKVRERALAANVQLSADNADPSLLINGDECALLQAMIHILVNGIKFTNPGGRVDLHVQYHDDGSLALVITDTGIGIADTDIEKVMTLFTQADGSLARRFDGAGIGLPLALRLVKFHDGTLELKSVVGVGTTVTIRLPAHRILRK